MNNLMKRSSKLNNKKGFTLVELIVVIVIIGILAAVLVPKLGGFTDRAKSTEALVAAKQVATAYDAYYAENDNVWSKDADAKAYVVTMSGVDDSYITLEDDGAFTVSIVKGTKTFQASRTSGDDAVELKDVVTS